MSDRLPALFLGHGSPMTTITDVPERRAFEALGQSLPRPRAILVVSAHWQSQGKTLLTAQEHPPTIHDFGGFPDELFQVQYPAPGSAELVERIAQLLGEEAISRDTSWGYDHGTWGVVGPMYPEADIPLIAMSVNRSLAPEAHFEIGAKLAPLRDEGVLFIASGNIIHNLRMWRSTIGTQPDWAVDFRDRINAAVLANDHEALIKFAPEDQGAALAINSAEHYLPLLYTVGARLPGDEVRFFNDTVDGSISMTSVLVGNTALLGDIGQ